MGGHERDDLAHLEPGRKRGDLRGRADAPADVLAQRRAAEDERFPAVGHPESEEEAERGGLARSVGSEEGEERPPGKDEIEPREGRPAAECLRHPAKLRGRPRSPTHLGIRFPHIVAGEASGGSDAPAHFGDGCLPAARPRLRPLEVACPRRVVLLEC